MARIYVASSWQNEEQPELVKALRQAGHVVYDFRQFSYEYELSQFFQVWSDGRQTWESFDSGSYWFRLDSDKQNLHRIFCESRRMMHWADTCVLLHPSGHSSHMEAGWFAGQGKRLIIYRKESDCFLQTENHRKNRLLKDDGLKPELMHLMADHYCVSIEHVLKVLSRPKFSWWRTGTAQILSGLWSAILNIVMAHRGRASRCLKRKTCDVSETCDA